MERVTIFVVNGNMFGYVEGDTGKPVMTLWVLAVDYMKGGDPMLLHQPIPVSKKDARVANLSDFDNFRVSTGGFLENPRYVFDREYAPGTRLAKVSDKIRDRIHQLAGNRLGVSDIQTVIADEFGLTERAAKEFVILTAFSDMLEGSVVKEGRASR